MRSPINYQRTAKDKLEELNSKIEKLQIKISKAPQGSITCKNNGHFYWNINGRQEYLGKEKEHIIRALLQKKYDKGKLDEALQEKQIIKKTLEGYEGIKTAKFPAELMKYVTTEDTPDETFIKEWSKPCENFRPRKYVNTEYYTLRGEKVRSKSEIIIADRLFHAGVPYHYEKDLDLVDGDRNWKLVLPDFTVLNTRTLKTYYWEHFGWLDKQSYRDDMLQKLNTYGNNGYFPGKNLIVTFETVDNQLSSKYVNQLIEEYLK